MSTQSDTRYPAASSLHDGPPSHRARRRHVLAVAAWCILVPGIAAAQQAEPTAGSAAPLDLTLGDKAAYELYPDLLDTSMSVQGDLQEDTAQPTGWMRSPTSLESWFAWKNQVRENTGLTFGGSWMMLWQNYSRSLVDEHNSVGSKLTLNFSYDLFNRGQANALSFDVAVEDRRPIGTDLAPLHAGMSTGSMIPTAATYGDFSLGVTQAYIRQNLADNRFQYTIGKIFAPNFLNAYPFFDDNRQFLTQAFSTSPSIASPLRGFGAVAAWYPTTGGLYIKPGVFTVHSSDTGSTIGDFFEKDERFYMLEVGVTSLGRTRTPIHARAAMDANNIHFTAWYKEAEEGGLPRARGLVFNANYMAGANLMWFARAGWSDGWFVDRNAAVGIGWRPTEHFSDLFGVAVGGLKPANPQLRNQYTAEVFYRFHVTPNLAITPDLQVQVDPALSTADAVWVVSLRGRLTF
ncbi:carbohydrate porin [Luteimonas sp. A482]